MSQIIVALLGFAGTLAGSLLGVLTAQKLTQYRLQQLEEKVGKHNNLIERTCRLEGQLTECQHEIEDLPDKYGPPDGVLHLILADGKPAGCIGLRKLDETRCEMKRLYVRPEYRRHQLGDQLVQRILQDARNLGYKEMLLDTLPQLDRAIRLYRRHGFEFVACYNDSPVESTVYMGKTL